MTNPILDEKKPGIYCLACGRKLLRFWRWRYGIYCQARCPCHRSFVGLSFCGQTFTTGVLVQGKIKI